jgi:threonine synthase
MKEHFAGYQCSLCGATYAPDEVQYVCPREGGNLDVLLDYDAIRKNVNPQELFSRTERIQPASLWRYLPLLPVADPGGEGTPLRTAGWTPVYAPPLLRQRLGMPRLWIKDESRNPTASFKDRASAVVVARARQTGAGVVVTASTGNAGAALAGMAAAVGQPAVIFAPRSAPPAKIAQLLVYGARVLLVDGSYDQAFDLSIEAAREFGWYCRNTGYNPFTAEGKKTAAFEIWEFLALESSGERRAAGVKKRPFSPAHPPLSIFVSVGDGNIISGLHKGFKDLLALGWLDEMPRLWGVQAAGSAAVARAFASGTERIEPVAASTLADSISVDLPRDGVRAVRAARQTGGAYLTVGDEHILAAIAELGQAGLFAEPAGAAAWAGLRRALQDGLIRPEEPVLVLNTGNGLKDVKAAMQAVPTAPVIEPSLAAAWDTLAAVRASLEAARR